MKAMLFAAVAALTVAVGAQARSVVMVEMMVGVFYIAMVVARMVGLTMFRRR